MSPWVLARGTFEPWRLWTCHALHFGWRHALVNLGAMAVPLAMLRPRSWPRLLAALLLLAPVLSLLILVSLGSAQYRGASGLACAAWAMAGAGLARGRRARAEGLALLGLLALKLALEAWSGAALLPGGPGWTSLPAAHRWGALLGLLAVPVLDLQEQETAGQGWRNYLKIPNNL